MPKHEFGIMPQAPQAGKCFDKYEPEKYNCISVSDDDLQPCLEPFLLRENLLAQPGPASAGAGLLRNHPDPDGNP